MNWRNQLAIFEKNKQWDNAIQLMQKVIVEEPSNMDAYLYTNFLLMNLLVEENYDENKHDYYANLLLKYFQESYPKFSENPEYLFFTAITAYISEWYFNIEQKDARAMLQKAMYLAPENILYKWAFYGSLDMRNADNRKLALSYAQIILQEVSPIKAILQKKGALGDYLLDIMVNWSQKIVTGYSYW
jgi:hypothetical protein